MEDDEEFSYTGYSAETEAQIRRQQGTFRDNEEVVSYSGYAEEEPVADEEIRTNSYGDFIVEEFSAATNVPRVAQITHLPTRVVTYLYAAVYLIVGVLCIGWTSTVTAVLPYIVSSMMIVIGVVRFIVAIVHHEYRHIKTNQTATSLIMAALGVLILLQELDASNDSAIMLISIVWGILGLFEGAHAFNHAFKRIANSERCVYYLIKGIVECAVAFMLLYQPDSHDAHYFHIIVFGVNLILDAITMLPQVKAVFAIK